MRHDIDGKLYIRCSDCRRKFYLSDSLDIHEFTHDHNCEAPE